MRSIRVIPAAAVLVVAALAPMVTASAEPTVAPAGHLAFITASGALDIVAVMADGTTTDPVQIAPVTKVAAPRTVTVEGIAVSADKNWLAWVEQIFKPSAKYGQLVTGSRLAVRNMYSGKTITLHTSAYPVGFAGSQLVVQGAYTSRVVVKPTPHLERIHEGNAYPVATYSDGIVDVLATDAGDSGLVSREALRLTTFSGQHTVLHHYDIGMDYRDVVANLDAVSPDGKYLLVERGNHQDFDGLGPSSLFDEYSMSGAHTRTELGHYGTNRAKWRLVSATFVGKADTPWLALHSNYYKTKQGYTVRGVVVSYAGGKWTLRRAGAVAVAGNSDGYVVVQPGKWQAVKNSVDGEYAPVPTGPAVLSGPGGTHTLSKVEASQVLWVTKVDPNNPEGI